jgi:hypothetical protein
VGYFWRGAPFTYFGSETFLNKLIGRNDIEDALRRLDKLEQGELRTVTVQVLKTTSDLRDVASDLKDGAHPVRFIADPYRPSSD